MKKRNPVAKHARKFNRAAVMTDRKQSAKAGYQKHKGDQTVSIDKQQNDEMIMDTSDKLDQLKFLNQINFVALLKAFDCLIDTAKNTTDLDNVYNDKVDDSVGWDEVHKLRDELFNAAKLANGEKLHARFSKKNTDESYET